MKAEAEDRLNRLQRELQETEVLLKIPRLLPSTRTVLESHHADLEREINQEKQKRLLSANQSSINR